MWLLGASSIGAAVLLSILLFSLRFEELWRWYDTIQLELAQIEKEIAEIDQTWLFTATILSLFTVKTVFPIYPTSTVCFLTGVVLPMYVALPVNIIGLCLLFSIRYYGGKKLSAGNAWKLISKNEALRALIQRDGKGNPWLLVALRLMPAMPLNAISNIYGSFDFGFWRFMVLSVVGFLPRLISFTFVGRNVFDPLSASFLVPLILLLVLSGISILSINSVWVTVDRTVSYMKNRKRKKGETANDKNI